VVTAATAIILAAGEGKRMGGPKALALLDQDPFLTRVVAACREGGCGSVWTVVRPGADAVTALAVSLGTQVVENPDAEDGMFSSVQAGLRAAGADPSTPAGFLVFPVDHPRVEARTIGAIVRAAVGHSPDAWIVPGYRGRPGHPVWIGEALARRILELPSSHTLRDALAAAGAKRVDLPVDDPGILENRNTLPPAAPAS
jgi:CTP:molybdopterin cytidylyltransferase MocA